ncbi:reverse transcriptase family protein [Aestuariibius sp. 2305UL40-4]|uniref:reverse transcriptase family protein n=1 Tax=Aestuariibius violaceus TaxID=3234132 RepID=UPI00345E64B0
MTDPLARRIAPHLTRGSWEERALADRLRKLLPRRLTRRADALAADLHASHPGAIAPTTEALAQTLSHHPSFATIRGHARKNGPPPPEISPPRFAPHPAFAKCALPALDTTEALGDWLALSPDQILRFTDPRCLSARTATPFAPHYRHHVIPKSNGHPRLIEEPKPLLKRLQRRLLHGLLDHVPAHPASYGFTKGRSAIDAAARHAAEPMLVGFDLKDFFPTVTRSRILGLFHHLGYPEPVTEALANLTTVLTPRAVIEAHDLDPRFATRHLPQGAPTSPALANLCVFRLDRRLTGLARSLGATYTRYADDLTFSGDATIAAPLLKAVPHITTAEGFRLNLAKTRTAPSHRRQVTTGIVVNAHPNLPRRDYDRLKAQIHQLGPDTDLPALAGRIAWALRLNPARGEKLAKALERKLRPTEARPR